MNTRGYTGKDTQRHLSVDCQSLRDLVEKLRQELLLCKSETQNVKDQLQCLIYLVRRAWSGDYLATIHISNIVGVQPPDFNKTKESARVNVSPQPDPIANWARLCIGILNKMYREEELELRASQLMYLQDREGYLDEELASYSDLVRHQSNMALLKTNTYQLLQAKEEEERKERQERIEQLEKQKQEIQSQYRKKHPPHTHLYKKPSQESIKQNDELNIDDCLFLVKSVGSSGVYRIENKDKSVKRGDCDFSDEYKDADHAAMMDNHHPKPVIKKEFQRKQPKQHTKPLTSDSVIPKSTKPRIKSAVLSKKPPTVTTRSRPLSAFSTKPKSSSSSSTNSRKYIDMIDRDLKMTTKTLQDRLGISKQGMV